MSLVVGVNVVGECELVLILVRIGLVRNGGSVINHVIKVAVVHDPVIEPVARVFAYWNGVFGSFACIRRIVEWGQSSTEYGQAKCMDLSDELLQAGDQCVVEYILRVRRGIRVANVIHAFEDGDIAYARLSQEVSPGSCHRDGSLAGSGREMITADASVQDGDVFRFRVILHSAEKIINPAIVAVHARFGPVRDAVSYANQRSVFAWQPGLHRGDVVPVRYGGGATAQICPHGLIARRKPAGRVRNRVHGEIEAYLTLGEIERDTEIL